MEGRRRQNASAVRHSVTFVGRQVPLEMGKVRVGGSGRAVSAVFSSATSITASVEAAAVPPATLSPRVTLETHPRSPFRRKEELSTTVVRVSGDSSSSGFQVKKVTGLHLSARSPQIRSKLYGRSTGRDIATRSTEMKTSRAEISRSGAGASITQVDDQLGKTSQLREQVLVTSVTKRQQLSEVKISTRDHGSASSVNLSQEQKMGASAITPEVKTLQTNLEITRPPETPGRTTLALPTGAGIFVSSMPSLTKLQSSFTARELALFTKRRKKNEPEGTVQTRYHVASHPHTTTTTTSPLTTRIKSQSVRSEEKRASHKRTLPSPKLDHVSSNEKRQVELSWKRVDSSIDHIYEDPFIDMVQLHLLHSQNTVSGQKKRKKVERERVLAAASDLREHQSEEQRRQEQLRQRKLQLQKMSEAIRLQNQRAVRARVVHSSEMNERRVKSGRRSESAPSFPERKPPVPRLSRLAKPHQIKRKKKTRDEDYRPQGGVSASILMGSTSVSVAATQQDEAAKVYEENTSPPVEHHVAKSKPPSTTPRSSKKKKQGATTQTAENEAAVRAREERRAIAREYMQLQKQSRRIWNAKAKQQSQREQEKRQQQLEILEATRLRNLRASKKRPMDRKKFELNDPMATDDSPTATVAVARSSGSIMPNISIDMHSKSRSQSEASRSEKEMAFDEPQVDNENNQDIGNYEGAFQHSSNRDTGLLHTDGRCRTDPVSERETIQKTEAEERIRKLLELREKAVALSTRLNGLRNRTGATATMESSKEVVEQTRAIETKVMAKSVDDGFQALASEMGNSELADNGVHSEQDSQHKHGSELAFEQVCEHESVDVKFQALAAEMRNSVLVDDDAYSEQDSQHDHDSEQDFEEGYEHESVDVEFQALATEMRHSVLVNDDVHFEQDYQHEHGSDLDFEQHDENEEEESGYDENSHGSRTGSNQADSRQSTQTHSVVDEEVESMSVTKRLEQGRKSHHPSAGLMRLIRETDDSLSVIDRAAKKMYNEQLERSERAREKELQERIEAEKKILLEKDLALQAEMASITSKKAISEADSDADAQSSEDENELQSSQYKRLEEIMAEVEKERAQETEENCDGDESTSHIDPLPSKEEFKIQRVKDTRINVRHRDGMPVSPSSTFWDQLVAETTNAEFDEHPDYSRPHVEIDDSELVAQRESRLRDDDERSTDSPPRVHSPRTLSKRLMAAVDYQEAIFEAHIQLSMMEHAHELETVQAETITLAEAFKEEMENNATSHQLALDHATLERKFDDDMHDVMQQLDTLRQAEEQERVATEARLDQELKVANLRECSVQTESSQRADAATSAVLCVDTSTSPIRLTVDAATSAVFCVDTPTSPIQFAVDAAVQSDAVEQKSEESPVAASNHKLEYASEEDEDDYDESFETQSHVHVDQQIQAEIGASEVPTVVSKSENESDGDSEIQSVLSDQAEENYEESSVANSVAYEESFAEESAPLSVMESAIDDEVHESESSKAVKRKADESVSVNYDDDFEASSPKMKARVIAQEHLDVDDNANEAGDVSDTTEMDDGDDFEQGNAEVTAASVQEEEKEYEDEFVPMSEDAPLSIVESAFDDEVHESKLSPAIQRKTDESVSVDYDDDFEASSPRLKAGVAVLEHLNVGNSTNKATGVLETLEVDDDEDIEQGIDEVKAASVQGEEEEYEDEFVPMGEDAPFNIVESAIDDEVHESGELASVSVEYDDDFEASSPKMKASATVQQRFDADDNANEAGYMPDTLEVDHGDDFEQGNAEVTVASVQEEEEYEDEFVPMSEGAPLSIVESAIDDEVHESGKLASVSVEYDDDFEASSPKMKASATVQQRFDADDNANEAGDVPDTLEVDHGDDIEQVNAEVTAASVQEEEEYEDEFVPMSEHFSVQKDTVDDTEAESKENVIISEHSADSSNIPSDASETSEVAEEEHEDEQYEDEFVSISESTLPRMEAALDEQSLRVHVGHSSSEDSSVTKLLVAEVAALREATGAKYNAQEESKLAKKKTKVEELLRAKDQFLSQQTAAFRLQEVKRQVDLFAKVALGVDVESELSRAKSEISRQLAHEFDALQERYSILKIRDDVASTKERNDVVHTPSVVSKLFGQNALDRSAVVQSSYNDEYETETFEAHHDDHKMSEAASNKAEGADTHKTDGVEAKDSKFEHDVAAGIKPEALTTELTTTDIVVSSGEMGAEVEALSHNQQRNNLNMSRRGDLIRGFDLLEGYAYIETAEPGDPNDLLEGYAYIEAAEPGNPNEYKLTAGGPESQRTTSESVFNENNSGAADDEHGIPTTVDESPDGTDHREKIHVAQPDESDSSESVELCEALSHKTSLESLPPEHRQDSLEHKTLQSERIADAIFATVYNEIISSELQQWSRQQLMDKASSSQPVSIKRSGATSQSAAKSTPESKKPIPQDSRARDLALTRRILDHLEILDGQVCLPAFNNVAVENHFPNARVLYDTIQLLARDCFNAIRQSTNVRTHDSASLLAVIHRHVHAEIEELLMIRAQSEHELERQLQIISDESCSETGLTTDVLLSQNCIASNVSSIVAKVQSDLSRTTEAFSSAVQSTRTINPRTPIPRAKSTSILSALQTQQDEELQQRTTNMIFCDLMCDDGL